MEEIGVLEIDEVSGGINWGEWGIRLGYYAFPIPMDAIGWGVQLLTYSEDAY